MYNVSCSLNIKLLKTILFSQSSRLTLKIMAEKGDREETKQREKFNVPPNMLLTFPKNKRIFYKHLKRADDSDAKRTKSAKYPNVVMVVIFVFDVIVNKKVHYFIELRFSFHKLHVCL